MTTHPKVKRKVLYRVCSGRCLELAICVINPRRACAARVTVLGSVCVSVCLSVCLSVKSHLTYGASVRPENAVTYSAGNGGQKICGDLPETTAFKSYAAKHERKSQYANFQTYPRSAFSA